MRVSANTSYKVAANDASSVMYRRMIASVLIVLIPFCACSRLTKETSQSYTKDSSNGVEKDVSDLLLPKDTSTAVPKATPTAVPKALLIPIPGEYVWEKPQNNLKFGHEPRKLAGPQQSRRLRALPSKTGTGLPPTLGQLVPVCCLTDGKRKRFKRRLSPSHQSLFYVVPSNIGTGGKDKSTDAEPHSPLRQLAPSVPSENATGQESLPENERFDYVFLGSQETPGDEIRGLPPVQASSGLLSATQFNPDGSLRTDVSIDDTQTHPNDPVSPDAPPAVEAQGSQESGDRLTPAAGGTSFAETDVLVPKVQETFDGTAMFSTRAPSFYDVGEGTDDLLAFGDDAINSGLTPSSVLPTDNIGDSPEPFYGGSESSAAHVNNGDQRSDGPQSNESLSLVQQGDMVYGGVNDNTGTLGETPGIDNGNMSRVSFESQEEDSGMLTGMDPLEVVTDANLPKDLGNDLALDDRKWDSVGPTETNEAAESHGIRVAPVKPFVSTCILAIITLIAVHVLV